MQVVRQVVRAHPRWPGKCPIGAGLQVGIIVAYRTGQEDTTMTKTTMKTLSTLTVLSALAFSSASAHAADDMAHTRGQVSVSSAAIKAVVAGPVAIHAYSGFSGGTIFAARAVTGTDADCKAQPINGS